MNRRQGFTLMELLLVVAVLAIVAAAAAPTFFGGATEAMDEARKASFLSAYQNAVAGANMALSIQAANGKEPNLSEAELIKYSPEVARVFKAKASDYILIANYTTEGEVEIVVAPYTAGEDGGTIGTETANKITAKGDTKKQIDDTWIALNPNT